MPGSSGIDLGGPVPPFLLIKNQLNWSIEFTYAPWPCVGKMVAGGCACLDSECLDSFSSSLEYTCNLCLFTQAWLFSVYNEQTWPFGTCLCLRLIRVIESGWRDGSAVKNPNMHSMHLFIAMNNCHM